MEISGRVARQILLFSLIVLIIPMIVFPELFGTQLAKASLLNALYELVFYGCVLYFLNRGARLMQLVQAAGLCLVYRLALGMVLGLLIAAMYPMQLTVAVTLGMSSYIPAILLQMIATPFILKPAFKELNLVAIPQRRQPVSPTRPAETHDAARSIAVSRERGYSEAPATTKSVEASTPVEPMRAPAAPPTSTQSDTNGFDRAVRYIGENGSVQMAAVVDTEGLLLGHFSRGDVEAEDWAPFALSLVDNNQGIVSHMGWSAPKRVDLMLADQRVVVAAEAAWSLMVVSERVVDDVLSIRINQGLEMIRKYLAERYGEEPVGNAERIYVPGA